MIEIAIKLAITIYLAKTIPNGIEEIKKEW